ncbi:ssDNA endonuclease and repair protein rad10 [Ophidiomyces ophidiicola]|nr:ssDNA endonuclease and repair protein rad10 [Ophidiomyces ophidiicola]KAI1958580.1 ssDNA endonuclease and repair protein rad10 [Ophidiomyces ophidiicola]
MDEEDFGEVPDFSQLPEPDAPPQPAPQSPHPQPPALSKIIQPKPQILPNRSSRSAILVSARQKGNPILNHVRLLPWEYADIPADYILGATTCALFLSLKYHRLHPEYVYSRIKLLGGKYTLRILLVMVDIPNHEDSLKELSKTSIVNNLTLILCWSAAEAGHYLELFKSSENAPPTAIRSQQPRSYKDSLVEFITTPRSINKSDAASLISTFGSLQAAIDAQPEQISTVPGWGERKVSQWTNAVKEEFKTRAAQATIAPEKNNGIARSASVVFPGADEEYLDGIFREAVEEEERLLSGQVLAGSTFEESRSRESDKRSFLGHDIQKVGEVSPKSKAEGENESIMTALAKLREEKG